MRDNVLITPRILQRAREQLDLSLSEATEYLKMGLMALRGSLDMQGE